ncbi:MULTISPECIES: diaminopimelate epimerase [Streptomyces]|uniref:Diaminopimelate epimerase n=1 Tax=Streptomyces ramulosus TaxID=47762 RepID=A0ABW1FT88_9ACTN
MTAADTRIDFQKYTAGGNDYLVLDEETWGGPLTPDAVRLLCDRRFGIGADGILQRRPAPPDGPYPVRIYNSDGSACERSGNGLRIFAQWLRDTGVTARDRFPVHCRAGTSAVEFHDDASLSVEMGTASHRPDDIGLTDPAVPGGRHRLPTSAGDLDVTTLSLGNPHTVVFSDLPPDAVHRLGHEIATHPLFRHGTNVQFVTGIAPDALAIEVWERGAGRTLASGASACAAATAALARGLVRAPVTVRMAGGEVTVLLRDGAVVWQRGSAHRVFAGAIDRAYATGDAKEGAR